MTTKMTCTARQRTRYLQTPVHIYVLHKRRCNVHVTHENIIAYVLMHYTADSLVLKDQYGMKIQFEVSRIFPQLISSGASQRIITLCYY